MSGREIVQNDRINGVDVKNVVYTILNNIEGNPISNFIIVVGTTIEQNLVDISRPGDV